MSTPPPFSVLLVLLLFSYLVFAFWMIIRHHYLCSSSCLQNLSDFKVSNIKWFKNEKRFNLPWLLGEKFAIFIYNQHTVNMVHIIYKDNLSEPTILFKFWKLHIFDYLWYNIGQTICAMAHVMYISRSE